MENSPLNVEKTLDDEFCNILRIIRPHIESITDTHYLPLYRMWLEKLNLVSSDQKETRNRYLIELCHQIQDVRLDFPFNQPPDSGPLPPFHHSFPYDQVPIQTSYSPQRAVPKCNDQGQIQFNNRPNSSRYDRIPANPQKLSCISVPSLTVTGPALALERSVVLYEYKDKPFTYTEKQTCICESLDNKKKKKKRRHPKPLQTKSEPRIYQNKQIRVKSNKKNVSSKDNLYRKSSERLPSNIIKLSVRSYIKESESNNTDSSWSDMSDFSSCVCSTPRLFSLPSSAYKATPLTPRCIYTPKSVSPPQSAASSPRHYQAFAGSNANPSNPKCPQRQSSKITSFTLNKGDLINAISDLRNEQEYNENVAVVKHQPDIDDVKLESQSSPPPVNVSCLVQEVNLLKQKLQDLIGIKEALYSTQQNVSNKWQNLINHLSEELESTQQQNLELNTQIAELRQKLESFKVDNVEVNAAFLKRKFLRHQEQFYLLKQHHLLQMAKMEKRFRQILNDKEHVFMQNIANLKKAYESKLREISMVCQECMENKNVEIQRLETTLDEQCRRMQEEVSEIKNQIEGNTINVDSAQQIAHLKNCLYRIDALYKNTERQYTKKIKKLEKKMSLKEKIVQLKLTTQRAELITTISSQTQSELDGIIIVLEEKYKQLLESERNRFLINKQKDNNLIFQLRTMIATEACKQ